jgi:hypothetical protein
MRGEITLLDSLPSEIRSERKNSRRAGAMSLMKYGPAGQAGFWMPAMLEFQRSSGGAVAQLGARLDGIEEVVGSNPIGSTNFPA